MKPAGDGSVANTSVTIGAEYDDAVLIRLSRALEHLEAKLQTDVSGMAGSQEVCSRVYEIGPLIIRLDVETYTGIRLSGDREAVDRIVSLIRA